MNLSFLYARTPRDDQVTPLDLIYERRLLATAALSHVLEVQIPSDKVLLLYHLHAMALAGGAQNVNLLELVLLDAGNTRQMMFIRDAEQVGENEFRTGQYSGFPIAPGHKIQLNTTFGAAALANNSELSVGGILVPRGNFSLGDIPE